MSLDFVLNPLTGLFDVTGTGAAPVDAMGAVNHGSDPDVARPDYDVVHWVGTVEPNNALDGDLWTDTDTDAEAGGDSGYPLYTFADTFTRADSSTALGVMEEPPGFSYPWQVAAGSATGWGINGNCAYHPESGYGIAVIDAAAAAVTTMVVSAGADEEFWLIFRLIDGANYYRFGHQADSTTYQMQKIVANSLEYPTTGIELVSFPVAADGDEVTVVTRPNDGIDAWVNGVRHWAGGDLEWYDSYKVGMGAGSSTPDLRISEFSTSPLGGGVSPVQQPSIATLGLDASAGYVEAEVQSISDKVDSLVTALRAAGVLRAP